MAVCLLISPAPVDGYPPVQYQAQLLAEAGCHVLLLTSNLKPGHPAEFSYPGVEVIRVSLQRPTRTGRIAAKAAFASRLLRLRVQYGRRVRAEIAYDAEGAAYAFSVPSRSAPVVTHLHEMLAVPVDHPQQGLRWAERYTLRRLGDCGLVVVADERRGKILQEQAGLRELPRVVRNLPLRRETLPSDRGAKGFSVVYHGSVGDSYSLDTIVASIPQWPPDVDLYLYGNASAAFRPTLDALAVELGVLDRVRWEGWVPLADVESRIRQHSVGLSLLRSRHANWKYAAGASNKRYQYMQAGLPQITDRNPGVSDLIEGNGIGRCIEPDDPDQVAEAVRFYYDHPAEHAAAGERAARLHYDSLYYEREFQPVLEYVLSQQPAGRRAHS